MQNLPVAWKCSDGDREREREKAKHGKKCNCLLLAPMFAPPSAILECRHSSAHSIHCSLYRHTINIEWGEREEQQIPSIRLSYKQFSLLLAGAVLSLSSILILFPVSQMDNLAVTLSRVEMYISEQKGEREGDKPPRNLPNHRMLQQAFKCTMADREGESEEERGNGKWGNISAWKWIWREFHFVVEKKRRMEIPLITEPTLRPEPSRP